MYSYNCLFSNVMYSHLLWNVDMVDYCNILGGLSDAGTGTIDTFSAQWELFN